MTTPSIEPPINGKEFQVLDDVGCLTPEAMCFTEQLGLHHQAVVERHIKSCSVCAQQLTDMAAVANKFRHGKPRVPIPSEIKLLSRQLALRSAALKAPAARKAPAAKVRTGKRSPSIRRPWYRSHSFQMALIGALGTTLAILLLALLLSGCKHEQDNRPPPPPPASSVKIASSRTLIDMGSKISALAMGPGGMYAAGSIKGQVTLLTRGAKGALDKAALEAFTEPKGPDAGPPKKRALHPGGVAALAFSRDGSKLVSVGGKTAALWDLKTRKLVVDLVGPQTITSVIPGPERGVVFFATDQGHVLRWDLSKRAPDAVPKFACGANQVPPARLRLPVSKRCVYGTYHVSKKGVHVCFYPTTGLLLHGDLLVRACRSGNMGLLNLKTRKTTYHMSGYVRAMADLNSGALLLARDDGKLHVFDPASNKIVRRLKMKGKPLAAAASDRILAVARQDGVLLWSVSGGDKVVAAVKTPTPAVWLRLEGDELQVMHKGGTLVAHKLSITQ